MVSELTRAVYGLLSTERPVTPAGAAYLLRNDFTPLPVIEETGQSLNWLARNGYARRVREGDFGPEYLLGDRKPGEA